MCNKKFQTDTPPPSTHLLGNFDMAWRAPVGAYEYKGSGSLIVIFDQSQLLLFCSDGKKDCYIIYYWLGSNSSQDEQVLDKQRNKWFRLRVTFGAA